MTSSLTPWIEVVRQDDQIIVQTRDFELFDFLDDYFLEKLGIDYTYVHTRSTATKVAHHQLVFPPEVTSKVIEDALAGLDPLEVRRIAELNGTY